MATLVLTYDIAKAIAQDTADRQMRAEGRIEWNEKDYWLAVATLNQLWFEVGTPKVCPSFRSIASLRERG